ncbi:MAG: TerD family protein [Selenomonadaceae bacterium]|nr:TerD family protein [Selenomonadaceae bacterium]
MKSLAECHDRLGQESEALSIRGQIVDEWQDRIKVLKENYATEDEIVDAQEKLAEAQKKIDALNQDAAPEETSPEEIDTSESLALRKGQRVPLTKDNPALNELIIESRWESDDDLEIDASAFLLGADGKTHADEDFIFYGNPRHNSGAVELDNSAIHIKLKKIPDAIERISFTLTIYEAEARKQNFGRVKVFVRVIDGAACKEIFCFDLRDGFSVETAIVGGEIYRHKGEWKFNAVGAGFSGGLKALCEMFGVEVD